MTDAGFSVALGLEYDGGAFHGFQAQRGVATVQETLEAALSEVAGEAIRVTAAGRTDTGVHATQQVVSFSTGADRPLEAWRRGVNSLLDDAISVLWSRRVESGFNARFDAIERRYVYIFHESETAPALLRGKVAWSRARLDEHAMSKAAASLLGERDFTSFRARRMPVQHALPLRPRRVRIPTRPAGGPRHRRQCVSSAHGAQYRGQPALGGSGRGGTTATSGACWRCGIGVAPRRPRPPRACIS